eukprot:scaffold1440_cov332-Pavlova_lutheri.AAC.47
MARVNADADAHAKGKVSNFERMQFTMPGACRVPSRKQPEEGATLHERLRLDVAVRSRDRS